MSRIAHSLAHGEPDSVGCVGFTVVKAGRVHLTHDSSGTGEPGSLLDKKVSMIEQSLQLYLSEIQIKIDRLLQSHG